MRTPSCREKFSLKKKVVKIGRGDDRGKERKNKKSIQKWRERLSGELKRKNEKWGFRR